MSMDLIVSTDQKSDAFWNRIHAYCEESNHGLIKRGVGAMKKQWHRINTRAQRFGGCQDQAPRRIGSSSNSGDIMKLAHDLYFVAHKKKCNFQRYWNKLQREQKWRSQSSTHSGDSKRTKIKCF